jgi:hypothetical protein
MQFPFILLNAIETLSRASSRSVETALEYGGPEKEYKDAISEYLKANA